jgi:predicted outer membrane repeat protein
VINSRFTGNRCDSTGPDLGGAAIRALNQSQNLPVYVVNSTFTGGVCSNGSGLSSIQVSWTVLNSVFTGNSAIGHGANPAKSGTPGGGSGGAIYLDGDNFTLTLDGTRIENNKAKEGGGAIFFVSNDRTGALKIHNSKLVGNPSATFETDGLPGIFFLGKGSPSISGSTLKK